MNMGTIGASAVGPTCGSGQGSVPSVPARTQLDDRTLLARSPDYQPRM